MFFRSKRAFFNPNSRDLVASSLGAPQFGLLLGNGKSQRIYLVLATGQLWRFRHA
jgi:hypothetical protein